MINNLSYSEKLKHTINYLIISKQLLVIRKTSIFWGVLNIIIGLFGVFISPINVFLLVLGVALIIIGSRAAIKNDVKVILENSILFLTLAIWNICASLFLSSKIGTFEIVFIFVGLIQLFEAVRLYRLYKLFKDEKYTKDEIKVAHEIEKMIKDYVKDKKLQHSNVIRFGTTGTVTEDLNLAILIKDGAIIYRTYTKNIFVMPKEKFRINVKEKKPAAKKYHATYRVDHSHLQGSIVDLEFNKYLKWVN